jgi:D-glycero-alpha-D-manno-heptose-7-phosphate kinase
MIISQTPLRISFAGGGTDLKTFYAHQDGEVCSSAIDKYIYVIVKERFDDMIYINYSKKEIVQSVDEIKHDLVREAMKIVNVSSGVEITTLADIPAEGSGLGSSSSVTVGLLNGLYAYKGDQVSAETLAQQACHIEIDILDKPIGKQDQYIAAYGGIKFLRFKWDESVETLPVWLQMNAYHELSSNLLLFYTGITRDANQVLAQQKKNTLQKMDILVKMKKHARMIYTNLEAGDIDSMGGILHKTWMEKKQVVDTISNPEIDAMYEKAREAGALGGKICGAGAGGFLLLYVKAENQNAVRKALSAYREMPFMLERHGTKIIFNQRRYPWK